MSSSAWSLVRGKPCSTHPLEAQSSWLSRPSNTCITISSGTKGEGKGGGGRGEGGGGGGRGRGREGGRRRVGVCASACVQLAGSYWQVLLAGLVARYMYMYIKLAYCSSAKGLQ